MDEKAGGQGAARTFLTQTEFLFSFFLHKDPEKALHPKNNRLDAPLVLMFARFACHREPVGQRLIGADTTRCVRFSGRRAGVSDGTDRAT